MTCSLPPSQETGFNYLHEYIASHEPDDPASPDNPFAALATTSTGKEAAPEVKSEFQKQWKQALEAKRSKRKNSSPPQDPHGFAQDWLQDMNEAIKAAAASSLPKKKRQKMPTRGTSAVTADLFEQRSKMTKQNATKEEFSAIQKQIKDACLDDYKQWVSDCVQVMEKAEKNKDSAKIFKMVKRLSGKPKPPEVNLTTDKEGKLLSSPEETAEVWKSFLQDKFKATAREHNRVWQPISPYRRPEAEISRAEFDAAVKHLKNAKATGPDEVPAEVYKYCSEIKEELFNLLSYVWSHECIPESLARGRFVMLWKHKGSTNDPSKYRCICLLNQAYKILANILLARLTAGSTGFLQDWQAGFRPNRGCRDNTMVLRSLCDEVLKLGKSLAITFIDYAAAFDSVSHKFIDEALQIAGVGNKERAIFRQIYKSQISISLHNREID